MREALAAAVVGRVFAIHSQDAVATDLGSRVRGRDTTSSGIRAAYEDERSIVRGWFMRGTLHTIPARMPAGCCGCSLPVSSPQPSAATTDPAWTTTCASDATISSGVPSPP
ncbi:DNA glycosylase AlkZ-like family protein [Nonomuraea antri]|uniref:DNA glycosylase AlkZ-like family protein n=1 Tax=Nonomuraea antri TaxID=2730852 RepID=UPI0038B2DAE4